MLKFPVGLACAAVFLAAAPTRATLADEMLIPVSSYLCDTADHAVEFAEISARGEGEEVAKDRVGRMARAEVCGRYVGIATIRSEAVTLRGGLAYKLTEYRFREDQRTAWLAETSFAPSQGGWSL